MNKKVICEVYGPGISVEHDRENNASVVLKGRLDIEVEASWPNPNLDAYFDVDYLMDEVAYVTINGREWEMDASWRDLDIDWWLTADDVVECAAKRADEDFCSTAEVLARWKNMELAPIEVVEAYELRC